MSEFKSTELSQLEGVKESFPMRWYIKIGKVEDDASNLSYLPDREILCVLNDPDMLILQQSNVMDELIEGSKFEGELNRIRKHFRDEAWGVEE